MSEAKDPYAPHPDAWVEPDDRVAFGGSSAERYGDRAFLTEMTVSWGGGPIERTEIPLAEFGALKRGEVSFWRLNWKYRHGKGLTFNGRVIAITAAIGVAVVALVLLLE